MAVAGGVAPTEVTFTPNTNIAVISHDVRATPDSDMIIHLDLASNVSITDSTAANGNANAFNVPSLSPANRLTDDNNSYILNTDTTGPTITAVTDIIASQSDGTAVTTRRLTS